MSTPDIPADDLQNMEQVWKYASDEADELIERMRQDLQEREERTGIRDDSVTFALGWAGAQCSTPQYLSMVCTAAFIKLARMPKAADPLEDLERDMKNDQH